MDEPPIDHAICACCGTHFGYEDVTRSHFVLRNAWLLNGGHWFDVEDKAYPRFGFGWSAWDQLDRSGFPYLVPRPDRYSSDSVKWFCVDTSANRIDFQQPEVMFNHA